MEYAVSQDGRTVIQEAIKDMENKEIDLADKLCQSAV
jgi:hypothetical protein